MFSRKSSALILPGLLGLALLVTPAYSSTIATYNTANSWQVALSSFQTIDFSGLAVTMYTGGLTVPGVNVQFLGMNGQVGVKDTASDPYTNFGTGYAAFIQMDRPNTPLLVPYIHIILPAPVTAVGFNIFSASPSALTYTVSVLAGQYSAPTLPLPTPAFWGITSDTPFTTVDLALQGTTVNGGTQAFVDNFAFETAVPEPSTSLLIGIGLTGIGLLRRRAGKRGA